MEAQRPQISQSSLEKEQQRDTTLLDFKLCYKSVIIKTLWYSHKSGQIREKTESPEVKPRLYVHDRAGKNVQWGKDSLFNKQCWEN